MKSLSLVLTLSLFSLFAFGQITMINEEGDCPAKDIEIVKKKIPGFYFDREYISNLKVGQDYLTHLIIKVPKTAGETTKIGNLTKIPTESKPSFLGNITNDIPLTYTSLSKITETPPGIIIKFKNRKFLPHEVICVEIKGKALVKGKWNPKTDVFVGARLLGITFKRSSTWNGMNFVIN